MDSITALDCRLSRLRLQDSLLNLWFQRRCLKMMTDGQKNGHLTTDVRMDNAIIGIQ